LSRWIRKSRRVIKRIGKGVEFVRVDRIVSGRLGEIIVKGGVGRGLKIGVIFGVIDGVIGAPFNDESSGLEERLTIVEGKGVDPGNGGVGDGKFGPTMAGDTSTGGKREEIKRSMGTAGGTDGDRTHGACVWGVGRVMVVKNLGVCAKFDAHGVIIRARLSRDKGGWAEGVRDAG